MLDSGDVYSFGWNKHGQLGTNRALDADFDPTVPNLVEFPVDSTGDHLSVKAIACGSAHSALILEHGAARELWAWGWGKYGQLGRSTDPSVNDGCLVKPSLVGSVDAAATLQCSPWATILVYSSVC